VREGTENACRRGAQACCAPCLCRRPSASTWTRPRCTPSRTLASSCAPSAGRRRGPSACACDKLNRPLRNSHCLVLKLVQDTVLLYRGMQGTSDQAPASVRHKRRMAALRKHALCRSAAQCTSGAAGCRGAAHSSADDDAPIQPVIQSADRSARTCAARATRRLTPEPGRRRRSTRLSRRASTAARTGRATACMASTARRATAWRATALPHP